MSNVSKMYAGKTKIKKKTDARKTKVMKAGKMVKVISDGTEIWLPSPEYVKELEERLYGLQDDLKNALQRIRYLETKAIMGGDRRYGRED